MRRLGAVNHPLLRTSPGVVIWGKPRKAIERMTLDEKLLGYPFFVNLETTQRIYYMVS